MNDEPNEAVPAASDHQAAGPWSMPTIEIRRSPKNGLHFAKLIAFCQQIVEICDDLGIDPVANASLAVFAYTQNERMEVHDIDLSCSESEFAKLGKALNEKGIGSMLTDWHVLRAIKGDMKVEFDSKEYWMKGIPDGWRILQAGSLRVKVVSLESLKELYRRGVEASVRSGETEKSRTLAKKYEALLQLRS